MDTLYTITGMVVVWSLIGAFVTTVIVLLWICLGAAIFTLKVCNYLGWKNSKGEKLTPKQAFEFWLHVLEGQHKGLYKAFHKEGYVLYPWPWLLVRDRKTYIERYEARERGC